MTREGYNKHKEVFEAWLDGKQIQILGENGQWIDSLADIKWKEHKEYRIKPTKIEIKDCSFNEIEYYVDYKGDVKIVDLQSSTALFSIETKATFFKDKKIAEAYAILPKLIRLRDEYNEGWKPDWEKEYVKYYIRVYKNEWNLDYHSSAYYLLAFKSEEIRDKFFNDHRDLIKIAKPLL